MTGFVRESEDFFFFFLFHVRCKEKKRKKKKKKLNPLFPLFHGADLERGAAHNKAGAHQSSRAAGSVAGQANRTMRKNYFPFLLLPILLHIKFHFPHQHKPFVQEVDYHKELFDKALECKEQELTMVRFQLGVEQRKNAEVCKIMSTKLPLHFPFKTILMKKNE
jgi:hypothetical protein